MAAVGTIAAASYATTISTHVSLGDAPESVAGVASLGILHDPGYVAYVVAARLFSWVVPVGSLTARVTLFSVVCSVLAVVGAFRVARRLGACRAGSAVGALAMALGPSFWFYAGFAKHDAFSTFVVVAAATAVFEWELRGGWRLLAVAGGLMGLAVGASWQMAALAAPGLALVLLRGRRDVWRVLLPTMAAAVVAASSILGFTMLRAAQDPVVNWGNPTSLSGVANLVLMKNFGYFTREMVVSPPVFRHGTDSPPEGGLRSFRGRLRGTVAAVVRELGVVTVGLAMLGLGSRRFDRRHRGFLAATLAVGLLGVVAFVDLSDIRSLDWHLAIGGFLAGISFATCLAAALGSTALLQISTRILDRRAARNGTGPGPSGRPATAVVAAAVLLVCAVVPSAVRHRSIASHRGPPFADLYGADTLGSLPRGASLLVTGEELAFPILYRQVVMQERGDVTFVAVNALYQDWYRQQLRRRQDIAVPGGQSLETTVRSLVSQLRAKGPVYMDPSATVQLDRILGYRTVGLVSEVTDGVGAQPLAAADLKRLAGLRFQRSVYTHPSRLRWPNHLVLGEYARAHLLSAEALARSGDRGAVTRQLELALEVTPGNGYIAGKLQALNRGAPLEKLFG